MPQRFLGIDVGAETIAGELGDAGRGHHRAAIDRHHKELAALAA
jgi:hypothetical protein